MSRRLLFIIASIAICTPISALAGEPMCEHGCAAVAFSYLPLHPSSASAITAARPPAAGLGFQADIAGNLSGPAGVALEIGFHTGCFNGQGLCIKELSSTHDNKVWTLMAGPRFDLASNARFRPWVQGLFGAAFSGGQKYTPECLSSSTIYVCVPNTKNEQAEMPNTTVSMAFGGGLDIAVSKNILVRAVNADYLRGGTLPGSSSIRVAFGIVFRNLFNHRRGYSDSDEDRPQLRRRLTALNR
jgi:hypothetical protein